jgi:hypothetical protein
VVTEADGTVDGVRRRINGAADGEVRVRILVYQDEAVSARLEVRRGDSGPVVGG